MTKFKLMCFGLMGLAFFAGCSKEDPTDVPCDTEGCAQDGDACDVSYVCQPGSICNLADEDLYDATKDMAVCIKVVCVSDGDCDGEKTCSLEKICNSPVCQTDAQCSGGSLCIAGACNSAPSVDNVTACEVATRPGSIRQGATIELVAIAKNTNGVVQPAIPFSWASDKPNVVAIAGRVATGGAEAGTANLTASVEGKATVNCSVSLVNFPNVGMADARVVVVDDATGAPVVGAQVTVVTGGNSMNGTSGADGSATIVGGGTPDSVTVIAAGHQYVSIISPGTNDIYLPLPSIPNEAVAGGFRGSVDISKTTNADIKLGIAGPSLPSNLLDFGLEALIGDPVKTVINAPELSLNNEEVDLPGGVMLGLGTKMFTNDMGGARCQGNEPGAGELGCYVARAPAGKGAAWVLAGQLKLSQVTPIATQLSGALGGGGTDDLPIGDLLTAVLPLLRSLNHGVNASVDTQEFPKVTVEGGLPAGCTDPSIPNYDDLCRGDFSKYQQIELAASQKLGILSAVSVPNLPNLGGAADGCAGAAVLVAAAILPGRGILPLGLSAGVDILDKEAADCKVGGVEEPFGANSAKLNDGQMPLTMAPPHSGIEGSTIALLALALDVESITDSGLQLNAIVSRVSSVEANQTISATYLPYPKGSLTRGSGTFAFTTAATGATASRFEIQRGAETWLVYAPASSMSVTLPTGVTTTSDVVTNASDAYVQAIKVSGSYSDMWKFGSGKTLDNLISNIDAFVVQQCDTTAGSACLIQ
jgi:hypothetical protein